MTTVPDAPTILKIVPRYSYGSGHFLGITVEFNSEIVSFFSSFIELSKMEGYLICTLSNIIYREKLQVHACMHVYVHSIHSMHTLHVH